MLKDIKNILLFGNRIKIDEAKKYKDILLYLKNNKQIVREMKNSFL